MTTVIAPPIVPTAPMDLLAGLSRDVGRFVTQVMPQEPHAPALKCAKEAREFADDPSLEEAADVMICLLGWIELTGRDVHDLITAGQRKMSVNLTRTWQQQPDGTWQHVDPSTSDPSST